MPGTRDPVSTRLSAKGICIMSKEEKKNYVGIDVSKQILDIYLLPAQRHLSFNNNKKGIEQLVNQLKTLSDVSLVMGSHKRL